MIRLNDQTLGAYEKHLYTRECSRATIAKYRHDVGLLRAFCGSAIAEKAQLMRFKEHLIQTGYAPASVNSILAAVNGFLNFMGFPQWKLRFLKLQRGSFARRAKEIDRQEYEQLVRAARRAGDERMALLLQTLCATGIRVSEAQAVTVESLRHGRVQIRSKGKIRLILLPGPLCSALAAYCQRRGIASGRVFVTRSGRPMDRSGIWKRMKALAKQAGVAAEKAFPHNLRRLFARTYYRQYPDIVRLADVLGHSSVDTTRLYAAWDPNEQRHRIEALNLTAGETPQPPAQSYGEKPGKAAKKHRLKKKNRKHRKGRENIKKRRK